MMSGRAAALMGAGGLVAAGCLLVHAVDHEWVLVRGPGPAAPDEVLVLVAAVAALVVEVWLLVSTLVAVMAHLPGRAGLVARRLTRAWVPATSRRMAAALLGAAAVGAIAPGAALADGPSSAGTTLTTRAPAPLPQGPLPSPGFRVSPASRAPNAPVDAPQPGWTPSRPIARPQASPALVTTTAAAQRDGRVVVHRGDTLWDIVRRQLGPHASDAEVARAWPAWHAANRAVIGPDPDLLLPGQTLRGPGVSTDLASGSAAEPGNPSFRGAHR